MTVPVNEKLMETDERLSGLYEELGKAYYEGAYEDPLPQLLPLFDQITEILKKETGVRTCTNCGAELEEDARFCDVCGTPAALEAVQRERICKNCGNVLRESAVFCGMCGTKAE